MTEFEIKVLRQVSMIPVGEVRTYKWVAEKIGHPRAARAVGTVLRKNKYTIVIPCHRVVRSNGDIGEYSLGREVKKRLLEIERRIAGGDVFK